MDNVGILNAADNTGAFRFVGVAIICLSFCSGFFAWYIKRPLRKLVTTSFDLFVLIFGVCIYHYIK